MRNILLNVQLCLRSFYLPKNTVFYLVFYPNNIFHHRIAIKLKRKNSGIELAGRKTYLVLPGR